MAKSRFDMTKMRFESAPIERIEELHDEVWQLLRHIASVVKESEDTEDEWLSYVFVTDESCLADFLNEEAELIQLRERTGFADLTMRDLIYRAASELNRKKQSTGEANEA